MTIKEFAAIAGVSVSTVSKIMNRKDAEISAETRDRVLSLAKEYNYKPYASVRDTGTKSFCLGVAFCKGTVNSRILEGMISGASNLGYSVLFRSYDPTKEEEYKCLSVLAASQIDGVLWKAEFPENEERCKKALADRQIPYKIIGSTQKGNRWLDYAYLGYIATKELIRKGHRKIACCAGTDPEGSDFLSGYRQCLFDNQTPFDEEVVYTTYSAVSATHITARAFSGIVVSDMSAAVDLYKLIRELHYGIPTDVSMVTVRDENTPAMIWPGISAVTVPNHMFGAHLCEVMIGQIEKKEPESDFTYSDRADNGISIDVPYSSGKKRVISFGSVYVDNYLNMETLPRSGRTVSTAKSSVYPGGKCVNEAVGIARLGYPVSAIGRVGEDADAAFIYETMMRYQVDATGIRRSEGLQTGQAYIYVQRDGKSMITTMAGANESVSEDDALENEELFTKGSFCLLQTEVPMPAILKAAELAKQNNMTTLLRPSAVSSLPKELLLKTDIIVLNREELTEIAPGRGTPQQKAGRLINDGPKIVIITLGDQGCIVCEKGKTTKIAAAEVVPVDTTGAGDAFISALVAYLLLEYDIISASKIATYAAAISTMQQGVVPALADKHTLEAHILRNDPSLLKQR